MRRSTQCELGKSSHIVLMFKIANTFFNKFRGNITIIIVKICSCIVIQHPCQLKCEF